MTWYAVICRIAFDEEDSVYVVEASTPEAATDAALVLLREDDSENPETETFTNYVIACGSTRPEVVLSSGKAVL